jgi:hypothetical protein
MPPTLSGLRMHVVYSTIGLAEVFILLASALGAVFLILRGIVRFFFLKKDETQTVTATDMHLNRRADRPSG